MIAHLERVICFEWCHGGPRHACSTVAPGQMERVASYACTYASVLRVVVIMRYRLAQDVMFTGGPSLQTSTGQRVFLGTDADARLDMLLDQNHACTYMAFQVAKPFVLPVLPSTVHFVCLLRVATSAHPVLALRSGLDVHRGRRCKHERSCGTR